MKTSDLLKKFPNTTSIIKQWFLERMLQSIEEAGENVPEEFKENVKKQGVTDEALEAYIEAQPRALFDVFDENYIFIRIIINETFDGVKFGGSLNDSRTKINFNSRKEAEKAIIVEAFQVLEDKTTVSTTTLNKQEDEITGV